VTELQSKGIMHLGFGCYASKALLSAVGVLGYNMKIRSSKPTTCSASGDGEGVLAALARKVRTLELAGEPRRRYNNTLRGLSSLPVRIT
jgi:hypothetical protein